MMIRTSATSAVSPKAGTQHSAATATLTRPRGRTRVLAAASSAPARPSAAITDAAVPQQRLRPRVR
ncbi:hypothetical protein C1I98_20740 [Spongiactinospora gelatinilytica]|uniref:Uncharacterized protein n=1 Tax=Spongiactinospora gelatinilytica TaxID=2666298 RepID=A0A2W2G1K4_9ACTN|nr:hypothetical protein [Spongiactinospora gelatinilytica]PZG41832.1 hypothetical protein C1I98_20740 [Spongiactinospora gelatinilytica]